MRTSQRFAAERKQACGKRRVGNLYTDGLVELELGRAAIKKQFGWRCLPPSKGKTKN